MILPHSKKKKKVKIVLLTKDEKKKVLTLVQPDMIIGLRRPTHLSTFLNPSKLKKKKNKPTERERDPLFHQEGFSPLQQK